MAPSLKERYDQRQLQLLRERAEAADAQLLKEQTTARLLIEAMDEEDLNKVSAIVQKLDTLKAPELPHLTAAIEQAQAELNKYTGGGPIAKAWSKLKTKMGIDNPVVKITTFADALERGMSQIPTILKNNGIDLAKADLNKSLVATLMKTPTGANGGEGGMKSNVTGKADDKEKNDMPGPGAVTGAKSDTQMGNTSFGGKGGEEKYDIPGPEGKAPEPKNVTGAKPEPEKINYAGDVAKAAKPSPEKHNGGQDQPPKPAPGIKPKPPVKKSQDEGHSLDEAKPPKQVSGEQKLANITAQIRKALAPGGLFGAFKNVPYIKGDVLAQELIKAPIKVFANVAKRVQQGAKASEIASDMKDQIQGQGDQQSKQANTAEPSQPGGQSQPGQPAKPATATNDTTGTGQQPPAGPDQQRGGGAQVNKPDAKAVRGRLARMVKSLDPEALLNALTKAGLDVSKLPDDRKSAA